MDPTERASILDDRILPATRILAAVVIVVLALAFVILFLTPDQTDHRFAWTIAPTMTAMLMGAGYGSAAYFYARLLVGRRWHEFGLGLPATTVFTWLLLAATVLHWDRFHHGTFPFLLWWWVYLITPIAVPAVWLANRRYDPRTPEPGDHPYPTWLRVAMFAAGGAMAAIAAWLFLDPNGAIAVWPWALTPLTSRVVAAFVAIPAVGWLRIVVDGRWSAAKRMLETLAIGLILLLVAVGRAWDQFDHGSLLTYAYVGGDVGTLVATGALYAWMGRRVAST
jgi:uncharacterized membrane protein YqhA